MGRTGNVPERGNGVDWGERGKATAMTDSFQCNSVQQHKALSRAPSKSAWRGTALSSTVFSTVFWINRAGQRR
jgi:hypothetical protein